MGDLSAFGVADGDLAEEDRIPQIVLNSYQWRTELKSLSIQCTVVQLRLSLVD